MPRFEGIFFVCFFLKKGVGLYCFLYISCYLKSWLAIPFRGFIFIIALFHVIPSRTVHVYLYYYHYFSIKL